MALEYGGRSGPYSGCVLGSVHFLFVTRDHNALMLDWVATELTGLHCVQEGYHRHRHRLCMDSSWGFLVLDGRVCLERGVRG